MTTDYPNTDAWSNDYETRPKCTRCGNIMMKMGTTAEWHCDKCGWRMAAGE